MPNKQLKGIGHKNPKTNEYWAVLKLPACGSPNLETQNQPTNRPKTLLRAGDGFNEFYSTSKSIKTLQTFVWASKPLIKIQYRRLCVKSLVFL